MNQGRILHQSTPQEATQGLKGKIWEKTIDRAELERAEQKFQVLSSQYNPDNSINIRVFSEQQMETSFHQADPQLEDVYFYTLNSAA